MRRKQHRNGAFTRIELLVVSLILVILLGVLVPQLIRKKRSAELAACLGNLKQIVLAELLWQNDHETGYFSSAVSTNNGGTLEYLSRGELFQHFKGLSNELTVPTILPCPSDNRMAAKNFGTLANSNLSYFVNMDAGTGKSTGPPRRWPLTKRFISTIFIGDRNVTNNIGQRAGIITVTESNYNQLGWNAQMHNKGRNRFQASIGNAATVDGSVHSLTTSNLQRGFKDDVFGDFSMRLALP